MSVTKTLAALALLTAAAPAAYADTLADAMNAAVETNPSLAAQRQRLAASREALPQAWAEALPQLSVSGTYTQSEGHGDSSAPRTRNWNSQASASQLLFGSGSVLGNTAAARASIRGAVADYDLTLENLLLDVATAYADVRQQQEVVAAQQTTANNLSTLYDYARAQFDAGVVTRTDVAQAQARLAQARTQLVQAQGALAAAFQAYQRLVGMPPTNLQAPAEAQGLPPDLDTALNVAGTQNPSLRGAVASADQAAAEVIVARSAGLPRASLEAGSSLSGQDDPLDTQGSGDSVGVRVTWPIFNGGAAWSRTRQQRHLRSAANLDVAAAERSVQEGVTNAWTNLTSARASVVSANEQVQASELAYQGIRLEQETGLRSTIDVLNQEQDLLTARLAQAQAERNLVVAERQLLAATGQLSVTSQPTEAEVQPTSTTTNAAPTTTPQSTAPVTVPTPPPSQPKSRAPAHTRTHRHR